jgi:hypothetical protein
MRMIQRGDGTGFAVKALAEIGIGRDVSRKNFDRHDAIEARVLGFVHLSHPARTERCDNFIRAESGAGGKRHKFVEEKARLHGSWVVGQAVPLLHSASRHWLSILIHDQQLDDIASQPVTIQSSRNPVQLRICRLDRVVH